MKNSVSGRRRPAVHISLGRAARLHRLVEYLAERPRTRSAILGKLRIGLRTFYRELELLRRCGVKVRLTAKAYELLTTTTEAEGRLPFPDPQLSFAEMAELAAGPSDAARRLAALLASVVTHTVNDAKTAKRSRRATNTKRKGKS
jgi:predicted DNA-binding transcriptional regulator YafY